MAEQLAFPQRYLQDDDEKRAQPGLSKRELIAAMAMQGLLAKDIGKIEASTQEHADALVVAMQKAIALGAVQQADALLAELAKEEE